MALIPPPPQTEPPARSALRILFASVHEELVRRAAIHKVGFALVWRSGTHTAEEFFAEAGDQGELFLQVAGTNIAHIAAVAQMIGKTLHDYILPEDYIPPRQYTISNGVVTLNPLP